MHGELGRALCAACGVSASVGRGPVHRDGLRGLRASGALRPDVVWFGEMPREMDAHLRGARRPATCSSPSAPAAASIRRRASWRRRAPPARIRSSSIWSHPKAPVCSPRPIYGPATEIVPAYVDRLLRGLALEMDDHLDMRREQELIDRYDAGDAIAAIDQHADIAGERAWIAGHGDDLRHRRLGKRLGLRRGAGARRIEYHGVVGFELLDAEGDAEQIADDAAHRLELGCFARRLGKRGKRRRVGLIGVDRSLAGQGESEGAEAGEQIGDVLGALRPIPDQLGEGGFSLARGLEEGAGGSLTSAPERSIRARRPTRCSRPRASAAPRRARPALPAKAPSAAGLGLTPSSTISRPPSVSVTLTLASRLPPRRVPSACFSLGRRATMRGDRIGQISMSISSCERARR